MVKPTGLVVLLGVFYVVMADDDRDICKEPNSDAFKCYLDTADVIILIVMFQ